MSWIVIVTVLSIIFFHWVSDFVLQSDEQAKNKSTSNRYLLEHILTYTASMTVAITLFQILILSKMPDLLAVLGFLGITFCAHFITDYITSRVNTKLLNAKKFHEFFVCVGFDQLLHYGQLLITYKLLFK